MRSASRACASASWKISSARDAASPTRPSWICSSECAIVFDVVAALADHLARLAHLVGDLRGVGLDLVHELRDLLGAAAGALGELADLVGDDREAAARFAGARRLDRRVQREQVRALRDAVDHLGDLVDVARLRLELEDQPPASSTRSNTSRIFSIASRETSTPACAFWFASAAKPKASRARPAFSSIVCAMSWIERHRAVEQRLLLRDALRDAASTVVEISSVPPRLCCVERAARRCGRTRRAGAVLHVLDELAQALEHRARCRRRARRSRRAGAPRRQLDGCTRSPARMRSVAARSACELARRTRATGRSRARRRRRARRTAVAHGATGDARQPRRACGKATTTAAATSREPQHELVRERYAHGGRIGRAAERGFSKRPGPIASQASRDAAV